MTLEQHRFELHRSTYRWTSFNKYTVGPLNTWVSHSWNQLITDRTKYFQSTTLLYTILCEGLARLQILVSSLVLEPIPHGCQGMAGRLNLQSDFLLPEGWCSCPLLFKCQQYIGKCSRRTLVSSTEGIHLKQISVHVPHTALYSHPIFL